MKSFIYCRYLQKVNKCTLKNIISLQTKRVVMQNEIKNLESEIRMIKQKLLKCSSIDKYLSARKSLNEYNNVMIEEPNHSYSCCKNPHQCIQEYVELLDDYFNLKSQKSDLIYAKDELDCIMSQIDNLLETVKNNQHVYICFRLDRKRDIVGYFMDYNNIFNRQTKFFLFGINGKANYNKEPYEGNTYIDLRLNINYVDYTRYLDINPIKVPESISRRWHGSMALDALREATMQINSELNLIEDNPDDPYYTAPITHLEGTIRPLGNRLTFDQLCEFYKNNNFTNSDIIPYIKVCIDNH